MFIVSAILDYIYSKPITKCWKKRREIKHLHQARVESHVSNRKKPIYYIIRYDDGMSCGWTVWERVALYGSIYAEDHHMIPVVDMQNKKNIYLEDHEVGCVNAWEKYYYQPGDVSLEEALLSNNYVLADSSQEWFEYIRIRKPYRFTTNYLRKQYSKYIRLNTDTLIKCEQNFKSICPDENIDARIMGICLRGSDYLLYNHPIQPSSRNVISEVKKVFKSLKCDYYFLATEDNNIFEDIKKQLPSELLFTYHAGEIKKANGLIGQQIRQSKTADEASIDYLTTLYILNRCVGLVGGKCGATIVAEYRKNPPYEHFHIF